MKSFKLDNDIDPNKIFLISRSDVEGRLEAEYYKPEISLLEDKIRAKTTKMLKDFILKIASGATPSVTEEDRYYSDAENGVPFLRVQNLQTNGQLYLEDVKHINKTTHEKYLKRSQVSGGDLLVKITGVGRMAIASVAPEGFIGNTNQHMVVIKTNSKETSEYLANFLNLDITEKLATRRSTGATRPALDYPALKSIPIVEAIDFSPLYKAIKLKQNKDDEAAALLKSIDLYMLDQLGLRLPTQSYTLESRIFTKHISDLSASRFDSYFNQKYFSLFFEELMKAKYPVTTIKKIAAKITSGITPLSGGDAYTGREEGIPFIRSGNINVDGEIDYDELLYLKPKIHNGIMKSSKLIYNDLMIAIVGATIGQVGLYMDKKEANINQAIALIRLKDDVSPNYIKEYIKSSIGQMNLNRLKRPVARANINLEEIATMKVILPPISKQEEISNVVQSIRDLANKKKKEGQKFLEDAKHVIERKLVNF